MATSERDERVRNESDSHAKSAGQNYRDRYWPVQLRDERTCKVCEGQHRCVDQHKAPKFAHAGALAKDKPGVDEVRKKCCDDTTKQISGRHRETSKLKCVQRDYVVGGCIAESCNAKPEKSLETGAEIHLLFIRQSKQQGKDEGPTSDGVAAPLCAQESRYACE